MLGWWFSSTSLRAGWLCPQLHDVLEQLEGPHDVVILGRGEGREWLEFPRSSIPGGQTSSIKSRRQEDLCKRSGRNRISGTSYSYMKHQPCSINHDGLVLIKERTF